MRTAPRRLPWHLAFAASWLLFAAPTLCFAGVLEHPCDCESMTDACDCSEGEGDCDDGCSHDGCENDPCEIGLPTPTPERVQLERDASGSGGGPFAVAFPPPAALLEGYGSSRAGRLGPALPGVRRKIPFHVSDIPLLL